MATIKSQMVLNDGMSTVLRKITHLLDATIKSFEDMQKASGQAVDTRQFQALHVEAAEINNQLDKMETYYIKAAKAQERLNTGMQTGTQGAVNLVSQIGKLAAAAGAGVGIKKLIGLSDQMTSTTARLSFLVDDGGSVDELEAKIMASAQRSRAAYLDTADAVASMGANAGAAFGSNDELIAFMEQVNKQFVIGGASAQGQSAAMLQLTQAMAAGALRGEELNSILENAPGIARAIEQYMGIAEGSIKQYAQEGQVTAEVVKNALFSVADETNAKFESMPMTWAQIWTNMQNRALQTLDPILAKLNALANSEQFNKVIDGALNALGLIAAVATTLLNVVVTVGGAVVDNWSIIAPLVIAAAGALGLYYGVVFALNVAQAIQNGLKAHAVFQENAHAAALALATGATFAETAAQYGLNAALYACPITWIVLAVLAFVAAIYAAVAVVNKFQGTSVSATGIIAGVFAVLGAHVLNNTVIPLYNGFAMFANFLRNVFNDPVAAVKVLIYDMALTVISYISNMAHAIENVINKIPGVTVDITSGLDSFYAGLEQAQQAVKDESGWVEYVKKMDYIDYGDAANAGYSFGKGVADKVSGIFNPETSSIDLGSDLGSGFDMSSIADNTGLTADNTGKTADALAVTEEQLEYLRDIAERDAINRFTTAEVKIDMTGMTNRIDGSADLDGVISQLTEGFTEALVTAAEGVHA